MGDKSKIEWTDATWNPVVGCQKISEGCRHCYAKRLHDQRHKAHRDGKSMPSQYAKIFETIQLKHERLSQPLRWQKPRMIFVNSVSDLFHADVPTTFIDDVFAVMALAGWHTFQVLTKRPERMREYLTTPNRESIVYEAMESIAEENDIADFLFDVWPLPNVWLGTSIENGHHRARLNQLMRCPAGVRFVSAEPLIGPLNLDLTGWPHVMHRESPIHWVIVGGESGKDARPMHPDWARAIRDDCLAAGVPFFFKQWGEWGPSGGHDLADQAVMFEGASMIRWGKVKAGRELDGVTWNTMPLTANHRFTEVTEI